MLIIEIMAMIWGLLALNCLRIITLDNWIIWFFIAGFTLGFGLRGIISKILEIYSIRRIEKKFYKQRRENENRNMVSKK